MAKPSSAYDCTDIPEAPWFTGALRATLDLKGVAPYAPSDPNSILGSCRSQPRLYRYIDAP